MLANKYYMSVINTTVGIKSFETYIEYGHRRSNYKGQEPPLTGYTIEIAERDLLNMFCSALTTLPRQRVRDLADDKQCTLVDLLYPSSPS